MQTPMTIAVSIKSLGDGVYDISNPLFQNRGIFPDFRSFQDKKDYDRTVEDREAVNFFDQVFLYTMPHKPIRARIISRIRSIIMSPCSALPTHIKAMPAPTFRPIREFRMIINPT